FGFGDEAEALLRAAPQAITPGGAASTAVHMASPAGQYEYASNVDRIRGEMEQFRTENPVSSTALNIAGAAVPAILTMGASTGVSAPGMTAQMLRAGRVGAGQGALAGAGAAEGDLGNRAKG